MLILEKAPRGRHIDIIDIKYESMWCQLDVNKINYSLKPRQMYELS